MRGIVLEYGNLALCGVGDVRSMFHMAVRVVYHMLV